MRVDDLFDGLRQAWPAGARLDRQSVERILRSLYQAETGPDSWAWHTLPLMPQYREMLVETTLFTVVRLERTGGHVRLTMSPNDDMVEQTIDDWLDNWLPGGL